MSDIPDNSLFYALDRLDGYNAGSDQVQTLIYACMAGISIDQLLKNAGIQFGNKLAVAAVKKISGEVLVKVNQKVGFRFLDQIWDQWNHQHRESSPGCGRCDWQKI